MNLGLATRAKMIFAFAPACLAFTLVSLIRAIKWHRYEKQFGEFVGIAPPHSRKNWAAMKIAQKMLDERMKTLFDNVLAKIEIEKRYLPKESIDTDEAKALLPTLRTAHVWVELEKEIYEHRRKLVRRFGLTAKKINARLAEHARLEGKPYSERAKEAAQAERKAAMRKGPNSRGPGVKA